MIKPILTILANLSKPISEKWSKKIANAAKPSEIRKRKSDEIDREIATDDAESANRRVDDWVRAIKSDQRRSGDSKGEGGPDAST